MERHYSGSCTIRESQEVKQPNGSTEHEWVSVHENISCQLSHNKTSTAQSVNGVANVAITIQLFISSDIELKAGSRIEVTQNGRTNEYKRSGIPAVYPTHQEVILEEVDRA